MNILVTGGAGYIGSHMVKLLLAWDHRVFVVDNLSGGHRDAVLDGKFLRVDLADRAWLHEVFGRHPIDAVIHFASYIQVGESVRDPGKYYTNNVGCTLNLLEAMREHGVRRLVFSSSAAVFGEPECSPIDEAHPKRPINPYGDSKWMVERILAHYDAAYGLRSVSLRYFNAAGADPDGELGERHEPETHLIPLVLQAASGRRPRVQIFGDDYPTPDGTCVRDYVHVADLCDAHLLALEYLTRTNCSAAFNLGNSRGYSVKEVIEAAERVVGQPIAVERHDRRPGDPAVLVADSRRAKAELGWRPRFNDIDTIVRHAWQWEQHLAKREKVTN